MASAPPRNRFNRSTLTRLLSDLAVAEVADSPLTVAERLGPWLDWTDAIALSTALGTPAAAGNSQPASAALAARAAKAAADELVRVRSTLSRAITTDELLCAEVAPDASAADDPASTDFTPYRHCCQQHQRAMAAAIGPLRTRVRSALTAASPALARLAALDAVLDEALAARERHALGRVPALLERHVARLRQAQADWVSGGAAAGVAGTGLAALGRTVQAVLLAELDVRLKPVEGLMDALKDVPGAGHMGAARNGRSGR